MTIRISRNAAGNCLNFLGSSMPAYFNACLSGQVDGDDNTLVNVVNDIQTANNPTGEVRYEFYQIPFTEFSDKDGNSFADAQAAADYISDQGNVIGAGDTGNDLTGVDVNFRLDDTHTSIIMDNGSAYGVNTIKAVADVDGTIHIHAIGAESPNTSAAAHSRKYYEKLDHTNVSINGNAASGGLNDVVDALNELFTVGAFESVVIRDPYSTMIADVDGTTAAYTLVGTTAVDPIGNDIFGNTGTGNYAGLLTTETIDQAGEYYTFDIRGEGTIGFGLVHTQDSYDDGYYSGNSTYADPTGFAVGNSAHFGYQFSHWFHPTPNGSWTNYGANTGYSMRPGWSNWDQEADWLAGNPIKMRCGIDTNGYISIESLQDDGTWVVHARTSYPVTDGSEYRLGIKSSSASARVYSVPKVHLLEPAAPTMYFRYIESPDGVYHYPLFASAEEAEYYDEIHNSLTAGTGSSHAHVYADDPTSSTWYMPEASHDPTSYSYSTAPAIETFNGNAVAYTEITSLTDAALAPPAFTGSDLTVDELSSVNYQTQPVDTGYVTTFTNLPTGLIDAGSGTVSGTAPEVTGDNVANPSDSYTFNVVRTNSYGTSTGQMTIIVTNLTAPTVDTGDWTVDTGTITAGVLQQNSLADLSFTLAEGERVIIPKEWVDAHVDPNNLDLSEKVFLGILKSSTSTTAITIGDFNACFRWEGSSSTTAHYVRLNDQLGSTTGSDTFYNTGSSLYDYAIELYNGDLYLIACNVNSINTEPAVAEGGTFSRTLLCGDLTDNGLSAPYTIKVGTYAGSEIDLDDALTSSEITKIDIPAAPADTMVTSWAKALDFSGSSERAVMVSNSWAYNPMQMGATSNTVSAPTAGKTVSIGYPWATTCVFNRDAVNSNQHIWNMGEGAGSTDDNIYIRTSGYSGALYFGWGRQGAVNEHLISTSLGSAAWYGVYIGFNGRRLSGADATAANLAQCFNIKLMFASGSEWIFNPNPTSPPGAGTWTSTGGRMDRSIIGDLSIGGRGSNRSYHGKVASFVTTTLSNNVDMPDNDEIKEMVTDPMGWMETYREGNSFRRAGYSSGTLSWDSTNLTNRTMGTQIFLMGDGTSDSYSNMIRNQVAPSDQNYTKLNLISMVSNDIENVSIGGLS